MMISGGLYHLYNPSQTYSRAELKKVNEFFLSKVVDYIDTLKDLTTKTEKLYKQKVCMWFGGGCCVGVMYVT